jgi:hypothetical protein
MRVPFWQWPPVAGLFFEPNRRHQERKTALLAFFSFFRAPFWLARGLPATPPGSCVKADLAINGYNYANEDSVGGLVVSRHVDAIYGDNKPPRQKILINPPSPATWRGSVVLMAGNNYDLQIYTSLEGTEADGHRINFDGVAIAFPTHGAQGNSLLPPCSSKADTALRIGR